MIHRVLVGGTASGKKAVAAELHRRHGLPLLSMDSMKVYRGMDIGTDKPTAAMRRETPFELLDLVGHDEGYSAGRWARAAREVVDRVGRDVLFAGGTPLYLRLLLEGLCPTPPADAALREELDALWNEVGEAGVREELKRVDPVSEARLFPGDRKRLFRALEVARLTGRPLSSWHEQSTEPVVPGEFRVVALSRSPADRWQRVQERVQRMLADGLVEEVDALAGRAPFAPEPARAIGYAEVLAMRAGTLAESAMAERIAVRTRQLLRKQRIALNAWPRIRWVEVSARARPDEVVRDVELAFELA
ncbi:MAG: tRNA (adenosine(37)-N6)-dimethylallyltransferase MiaA [Planctomycetota bacterium]